MRPYYKNKINTLVIFLSVVASSFTNALSLSPIFSSGAVLQRDQAITIWGSASENTKVRVKLGDEQREAVSNANSMWSVTFPALAAHQQPTLTVESKDQSITVDDLIVGDLWLASGQSNMEWVVRNTLSANDELKNLGSNQIRHFKVPKSWSAMPSEQLVDGEWTSANTDELSEFSAVAYHFAKKVHAETGIPIGIINTSWGGAKIEAWMSAQSLNRPLSETAAAIQKIEDGSREAEQALAKRLKQWPGAVVKRVHEANADWSATQIDTSDWLALEVPKLWENSQFPGVDGVIWYRKSFNLSKAQTSQDIVLGLGRIDDSDRSWINGTLVGETNAYDKIREYKVPASALVEGRNTIAIRVEDTGGGGGIYSDPSLLFVRSADGSTISLAGEWLVRPDKIQVGVQSGMNYVDTALFNKMLHPLFKQAIAGVLWYQGESNAGNEAQASAYTAQFQAMINDWRDGWNTPDLPFYWVQLANFESNTNVGNTRPWAILRESQTAALSLPNTGQAISIDVGEAKDIHPRDKQTVGLRLAAMALNDVYGLDQHTRGPVLKKVKNKKNKITVYWDTEKKLKTQDETDSVLGFEVLTKAGELISVDAIMKGNKVLISTSDDAVELRYAWDDNPESANLSDSEGWPAEPFKIQL